MSIVQVEQSGAESMERAAKILGNFPGGIQKASYSALKRAGDSGKTQAGRLAAAEYTINKGTFDDRTFVKVQVGSSGGDISLDLSFMGSVIPLILFNTKYARGGKINTVVSRSGGGGALDRAFAAQMRSFGIYERVGELRFPVEQKFGPSTAHMMANDRVKEQMDETISGTFEKRLDHEISRILNGW